MNNIRNAKLKNKKIESKNANATDVNTYPNKHLVSKRVLGKFWKSSPLWTESCDFKCISLMLNMLKILECWIRSKSFCQYLTSFCLLSSSVKPKKKKIILSKKNKVISIWLFSHCSICFNKKFYNEVMVMLGDNFCFLFLKTCFREYKEKTIFLYFWNQKHVGAVVTLQI